jgi:diketogulonate reductase-like aldo/keto reductase
MFGSIFDKLTLNNGYQMPRHGTGPTRFRENPKKYREVLDYCIENGYRSFDSGARYGTEKGIGELIRTCGIPRDELFVTTKVNNIMHGYDKTKLDFENSYKTLGLDYIDLYLIHCPVPVKGEYVNTWRAINEIYESGRVKAIGVSNFTIQHFYNLFEVSDIVPAVNQIEQHPFYFQPNLSAFMKKYGIISQSYSPLGRGRYAQDDRVNYLANKHHKTIAQIILRWHIQSGFMLITNSSNPTRIKQNANIYDFELSPDDMAYMSSLNHLERMWHNPERFPGSVAHNHVERMFKEVADQTIEESNTSPTQKGAARQAIEELLSEKDIDGTIDIIIYCFQKAVAAYGPNKNIKDQAVENARIVAKEFVNDLLQT